MHRILPLLFTLLPAVGMAVVGKSRSRSKKKGRADSDVIVKDTGGMPGPETPRTHAVTVHHPGVGASHGTIYHPDLNPSCYEDATSSIDLRDVPQWEIQFGSGSQVSWDGKTIQVGFAKGGNNMGNDDWVGDEHLDAIVLTTHDALGGPPVTTLSHPIKDPQTVGFTIHLRKSGTPSAPGCHFK